MGGPPGGLGEVRRPSHWGQSGPETLPVDRECTVVSPGGPGGWEAIEECRGAQRDMRGSEALLERRGGIERPFRRAGRGRESLHVGSVGSGGPHGGRGGDGRPSQMARRGWEALSEGRGGVRRPSRRAMRGQEALLKGQKWSGSPRGELGGFWRPSRRARRGQEAISVRPEWSRGPPGWLVGFGRPSLRARRGWEVLLEG